MKKDLRVYIEDIVDSCAKIAQYIDVQSKEQFEENIELQDAVIRRLQIVGEAVKRLPQEYREKHAHIDWRKAAAMRDVLVHDYDDVDMDRVWVTITKILPPFKNQIEKLIVE